MDHQTAFHEAGHAWAYRLHDKPLRYVSIRPRRRDMIGVCQPWKPRRLDLGASAVIACAGPITQAHYEVTFGADAHEFEFEDHLSAAILFGGDRDYELSHGMLDDSASVALLRERLAADWSGVARLAHLLTTVGTVSGRHAFEVLGHG